MPATAVRSAQILDATVTRDDLNTVTTGKAVASKIIAGTNITIGSTGVDPGTGDVTINASSSGVSDGDKGDVVVSGAGTVWNVESVNGAFSYLGVVTPAQITLNQNDYAVSSSAVRIRLSSDASRTITGIAGGTTGRLLIISNVGSFNIVFNNEDAASVVGNRFALTRNITLFPNETIYLLYDVTATRWRMTGKQSFDGAAITTGTITTARILDTNSNISVNNLLEGYATTATAVGTTTLTVASAYQQYFTGTTTQTVVLPDATTLTLGHEFIVINRSTGNVTVNRNGGTLSLVVVPDGIVYFQVTNIGTAAGTWDNTFIPKMVGSGTSVYTYPSATDTIVGRTSIDTLTNKRIDPLTNTMSGGVYSLEVSQAATALTTVLTGATWTMPANFASAGTSIRVKVYYRFVKTTTPPTLTCNLNVGGSSVASFIITSISSATTSGGWIEGTITIRTLGATGTLMSQMVGSNDHGITAATNWNPQIVNIATSVIDTTAAKVISLTMFMTTVVASNVLTISQGTVEIIKL